MYPPNSTEAIEIKTMTLVRSNSNNNNNNNNNNHNHNHNHNHNNNHNHNHNHNNHNHNHNHNHNNHDNHRLIGTNRNDEKKKGNEYDDELTYLLARHKDCHNRCFSSCHPLGQWHASTSWYIWRNIYLCLSWCTGGKNPMGCFLSQLQRRIC